MALRIAGCCVVVLVVVCTPMAARQPTERSPSVPSSDQGTTRPTLAMEDVHFIQTAGQNNKAEIELAALAVAKTGNRAVRDFAERLYHDHTAAEQALEGLARQKGVAVPDAISESQRSDKARLQKLDDEAFDAAYVRLMVTHHESAVADFSKAARSADPDVRAFAQQTLPTLQEHLTQARKLDRDLSED